MKGNVDYCKMAYPHVLKCHMRLDKKSLGLQDRLCHLEYITHVSKVDIVQYPYPPQGGGGWGGGKRLKNENFLRKV